MRFRSGISGIRLLWLRSGLGNSAEALEHRHQEGNLRRIAAWLSIPWRKDGEMRNEKIKSLIRGRRANDREEGNHMTTEDRRLMV
jgi:hypothetical protein